MSINNHTSLAAKSLVDALVIFNLDYYDHILCCLQGFILLYNLKRSAFCISNNILDGFAHGKGVPGLGNVAYRESGVEWEDV